MIFSIFAILSALSISLTAAYYSILGLVAIFPAAEFQIILMGIVLEVGKCVSVLWLHYNWDRAKVLIRSYLSSAVIVLMIITSLGIFGGLSKAHQDQAIPSGNIQAQVLLFDEKIKSQRDDIDSYRKALTQMDAAVDQLMGRTTDEHGADKAVALRKTQAKERITLLANIDQTQKKIQTLQEQRAPIASQLRKVEADVGPIKYVAALIYGNKTNEDMLEAAVRWVIIMIVLVFDPLAIVLLLAATTSIDWSKLDKRKKIHEDLVAAKEELKLNVIHDNLYTEEHLQRVIEETKVLKHAELSAQFEQNMLTECNDCLMHLEKELPLAQEELANKSREQVEYEEELVEVTNKLSTILESMDDVGPTITGLEEECAELVTTADLLRAEISTRLQDYDTLLIEKDQLEEVLEDNRVRMEVVEDFISQVQRLQKELTTKNSIIQELNSSLDELQQTVDVIPVTLNDQIKDLKLTLEIKESEQLDLVKSLEEAIIEKNEQVLLVQTLHKIINEKEADQALLTKTLNEIVDEKNVDQELIVNSLKDTIVKKDNIIQSLDLELKTYKDKLHTIPTTYEEQLQILHKALRDKDNIYADHLKTLQLLIDNKDSTIESLTLEVSNRHVIAPFTFNDDVLLSNEPMTDEQFDDFIKSSSTSKLPIDQVYFEPLDLNDNSIIEEINNYESQYITRALSDTNTLLTKIQVIEEPMHVVTEERKEEIATEAFSSVFSDILILPKEERLNALLSKVEDDFILSNNTVESIQSADVMSLHAEDVQTDQENELSKVELPKVDIPVGLVLPVKSKISIPNFNAVADNFPLGGNASFGVAFPPKPVPGDLFLRVDYMPSKLFKHVGDRWIEISNASTSIFSFDVEYIKLLIARLESGEYNADDLSESEREQISQYLENEIK
jgi:hypothetical protein